MGRARRGRGQPTTRRADWPETRSSRTPSARLFSRAHGRSVLQLFRMIVAIGLLTTVAAVAATPAVGAEISGAGATFPYPTYAKWAEAYKKATGVAVNYQPVGSGEGIRQIQNKEVTFGASDMPLKPADLDAYGLVQFPTVIGGAGSEPRGHQA